MQKPTPEEDWEDDVDENITETGVQTLGRDRNSIQM